MLLLKRFTELVLLPVCLLACFASGIEAADLTSLLEQFEETQGGFSDAFIACFVNSTELESNKS